jgi:hypothetical protein
MSLSNKPQTIDESSWYYEEKKGIEIVHEIKNKDGSYLRTDFILIPWRKLKESLRRKRVYDLSILKEKK